MKILRRLFALEIEVLFALLSFRARKSFERPRKTALQEVPGERYGGRATRRRERAVQEKDGGPAGLPGLRRALKLLGKRRDRLFSIATSVLAHAALLLVLVKIPAGGPEREEADLRITLFLSPPLARKPSSAGPTPEVPLPAPAEPPGPLPHELEPTGPAPEESPQEKKPLQRNVMADLPDPSADEPGSPGTGEVARAEPEGRPGPPAVLGVGASPPPGEGDGQGGDGQGDGIGSRTRGKAAALRLYGGDDGTEDAVKRGLAWLAAHQDPDGGWSAADFDRHCRHFTQCAGKGLEEFDAGVTALSALAFLGAGQTPGGPGPYGRTLDRALKSLLAGQRSDGALGARGQRYLYNHALATLAVCEAYAMTREPRFLKPALAALNFSIAAQQRGGGWDYTEARTGRNDLSITGFIVMAFRAAEAGGLPASQDTLRQLREFLSSATTPSGEAIYAQKGIGAGRRGINMTAVGLLSRLYQGTSVKDPWVEAAADRLMRNPPDAERVADWDRYFQSSYYWYSATLCLFHLGGKRWEAWNHFLKRELLPLESRSVHEAGSWPPDPNWVGAMGGRVFTTAMNVLTLEVYYRYPPLHTYRTRKE